MENIQKELFALKDEKYKDFTAKLIPNINKENIIGIRTMPLRMLARRLYNENETEEFLNSLPHTYLEENNLHAFLIEQIKDFEQCIEELDRFLPYIDNWATCDMCSPKILEKNITKLAPVLHRWITSEKTYTCRFGMSILMKYFLDAPYFNEDWLHLVADIHNKEYYIRMMQAWFFATSLWKQYEKTIIFLEEKKLDYWVHNKTIQKAIESNRISHELKQYLKTLKIKNKQDDKPISCRLA